MTEEQKQETPKKQKKLGKKEVFIKLIQKKRKLLKWTILFFCIFFLLGSYSVLIYIYLDKRNDYETLLSDKSQCQEIPAEITYYESIINDYEEQIQELQEQIEILNNEKDRISIENNTLKQEKEVLEDQIEDYKQRQTDIRAYNNFHDYINFLIAAKGFAGFSEEEYNTARAKAQETGNNDLVAIVDQIWNEHEGNPTEKFTDMIDEVIEGIYSNL